MPPGSDLAVPAVAVAEYLAGVLADEDGSRSAAQRGFLERFLGVVPVCDYDREVAAHHAELLAYTRETGQHRGALDLIVAATARATGRVLVTTDEKARFGELPGVVASVASVNRARRR
ncbi:type II toxin-antitoxin system VapC family toxin [Amycolatopsis suaedae]|uniref:Type II toxin-antitoxin system VapC family toxin n=2 Tax=Amycolatopsis suaedae TaxID=2510978 RepID=A0A4V2EM30_9PSEU|nr:type II toxin-antitoxin system VapC family toxin [Amycolatopsis suaedae]